MLNISHNKIDHKIDTASLKSFALLKDYNAFRTFTRILIWLAVIMFLFLFLPWTQNIQSRGFVTTLYPEQRPQTVHSAIAGRIEKWYVKEGNFVKKGDTILFLSEIKEKYLDPNLLSRTQKQIDAKELSVQSYKEKVEALESQIVALNTTKELKIEQAKNYLKQSVLKVQSDSINLVASIMNMEIAERQFKRMESLYKDGLKSLTDYEKRKLKLQETKAKKIGAENKLLASKNGLINAKIELSSVANQYKDKLAKAASEKSTAYSKMYDAEATVNKIQNQFQNYSMRSGQYFITAPQDGYITKAIRTGIGETIKSGEKVVSIMPSKYDLAVETYVLPVDLPLIEKGQEVRFIFDGWPSVVFSGWPNVSYGTYGGKIVAIDNFISSNQKYRILVAPDTTITLSDRDDAWPKGLRIGSGASGIALLKDVPIWYEIWRKLNGFPPDYYKGTNNPGVTTTRAKK